MGWTELIKDDNIIVGVVGDAGWDLAHEYIEKMCDLYIKEFGRAVNKSELLSSVEFVCTGESK